MITLKNTRIEEIDRKKVSPHGKNPKMYQNAIAYVMGYRKALRGGGTEHGRIAEMLRRSTKSIHDHILKHDRAVERPSYCPICRRARSPYDSVKTRG